MTNLFRNITVEPTQRENFAVKDVNSEENQKRFVVKLVEVILFVVSIDQLRN